MLRYLHNDLRHSNVVLINGTPHCSQDAHHTCPGKGCLKGSTELQAEVRILEQEVNLISQPFFNVLKPKLHCCLLSMPVHTASETELSSSAFTDIFVSVSSCGKKALEETFVEVLAAYKCLDPDTWHCVLVCCWFLLHTKPCQCGLCTKLKACPYP